MQDIIKCNLSDLSTESDVEQKFIIPLLTTSLPLGLDYNVSDFKTKVDIRKLKIDKGNNAKYYFPDYAIIHVGLPLLIIEAKKPGEDLIEAYREARLYASEINVQYPSKINPCHKIIVTDGKTTIAGFWDSEDNLVTIDFDEINGVSPQFIKFLDFTCKKEVFKYADSILESIRGTTKYSRPLSLLGGLTVQNEELKPNGFGSTISLEFKYLFNPESFEERKSIVQNAYVKTNRTLKQVDPIEKVIKATIPISARSITTINDTSQPLEITSKFSNPRHLKNQLLLLVGSVGSGKSTFTDYLKEVGLNNETKEATIWISVNLNLAPLNREAIYKWLKEQIVEKLIRLHNDLDFEDAEILQKIYSVEFQALKKGPASFFEKNSENYRKLFSDKLIENENNLDIKTNAFVRYLCAEKDKLLIIVLDNCDKRNLDDQLLMFDVANWLKVTYNCLVFLPLRDTTFDNFRKEPPLDTVIKDFVFRIDPPLLKEVISERLKYALREMGRTKNKLAYTLPNNIVVEYPHSDQGYYLASIVRSLFESPYFSRLVSGLAGRDIRKGLEIFLDFCKSGHITESEIFKIRQSKGQHVLPNHLISRVVLRGNKRFYLDTGSLVKNLFSSRPEDRQPNPFTRLTILRWLKLNAKKEGPSRAVGYHKISKLFNELISYGHAFDRLNSELEYLIQSKCAVTESQTEEKFDLEDLIAIAPAGMIHLELLNDLNYIAACAEDVWYRDLQTAEAVQKRITNRVGKGHYTKETTIINSRILLEYLEKYRKNFLTANPDAFIQEDKIVDYIRLDVIKELLEKTEAESTSEKNKFLTLYPINSEHDGEVVSIQSYGIFVEFGLNAKGLIHVSKLGNCNPLDFDLGDSIRIMVEDYQSDHKRFSLILLQP